MDLRSCAKSPEDETMAISRLVAVVEHLLCLFNNSFAECLCMCIFFFFSFFNLGTTVRFFTFFFFHSDFVHKPFLSCSRTRVAATHEWCFFPSLCVCCLSYSICICVYLCANVCLLLPLTVCVYVCVCVSNLVRKYMFFAFFFFLIVY